MKCGKCGKEMEIQGLNRTWPPKKDDMGRDVCPHCAHPNGPGKPQGATGFIGTFGTAAGRDNVDWAKLVDDLNKAMKKPGPGTPQDLGALFSPMTYIDDIVFDACGGCDHEEDL